MDLSIFTPEELEELRQNALSTLKLLREQVAGIPKVGIPALNLIQINEMEKRVLLYEAEINNRLKPGGPSRQNEPFSKEPASIMRQLIQKGHTGEALEILIQSESASENKTLLAEALLLSNRWSATVSAYQQNRMSRSDYAIESTQITHALIELLDRHFPLRNK